MELQALGLPVEFTSKLTLSELALPGSGFAAVIAKVPAAVAVPVAINSVVDTNVTDSGVVPNLT